MGADIIRLPDGRTVSRNRARGMGWIDKDGNLTDKAPQSRRDVVAQERAARSAQWRRTQGLDTETAPADPAEAAASAALAGHRKRVEPLVPSNVTPEGEPITDKETLDEIAARTTAIEAEKAARDA